MESTPERKRLLALAKELDDLERDLTSREADFLDKVLKIVGAGGDLTAKETKDLEALHGKYFSETMQGGAEDDDKPVFDRGEGGDRDEDDFV